MDDHVGGDTDHGPGGAFLCDSRGARRTPTTHLSAVVLDLLPGKAVGFGDGEIG